MTTKHRVMTKTAWFGIAGFLILGTVGVVYFDSTDVALISALGVILVALFPQLVHIRKQVQNSHDTNLRDDVDKITTSLEVIKTSNWRTEIKVDRLSEKVNTITDRVDDIDERTEGHER